LLAELVEVASKATAKSSGAAPTFEHAPDACEGAALSRDADVQLEEGTHNECTDGLQPAAAAAAAAFSMTRLLAVQQLSRGQRPDAAAYANCTETQSVMQHCASAS
jgi:hypothetical protein